MSGATTRGVVFVHSAPPALCPHVEWAAGGVLDARVTWTGPAAGRARHVARRAVLAGAAGTGRAPGLRLRGWAHLRTR